MLRSSKFHFKTVAQVNFVFQEFSNEHNVEKIGVVIFGSEEAFVVKISRQSSDSWIRRSEAHIVSSDTRKLTKLTKKCPRFAHRQVCALRQIKILQVPAFANTEKGIFAELLTTAQVQMKDIGPAPRENSADHFVVNSGNTSGRAQEIIMTNQKEQNFT